MHKLLRCDNISKYFSMDQPLVNISFTAFSGEILGIIGPNGAGKTTLMECISGLLPFQKGQLFWENQPLPPAKAKEHIFYLPDAVHPYGDQSVGGVTMFFRHIFGASKSRWQQLIEQFELTDVLAKRVNSLSKGFHRRLLLFIGLLSPQPLLMLDEPFDGFDLRQTLGIMELLKESLNNRTLLLSIHQLSEAEKICDRFLLLNGGVVATTGSLADLQKETGLENGNLEEVFLAIV